MDKNAVIDIVDAVVVDIGEDIAVVVYTVVVNLGKGVFVEVNSSDAGPYNAPPCVGFAPSFSEVLMEKLGLLNLLVGVSGSR